MISRILTAMLPLAGLIGGVYLYGVSHAAGGRAFFSPETFAVKSQSEILLPLTNIPIYRSSFRYRDEQYELVKFLVRNGYWTPIETDDLNWILMFHVNAQWRDGRSRLFEYMCEHPEAWIEWTKSNPALAQLLWPKVLSLLRREITGGYVEHVMFLARRSSSTDEFRDYVNNDPELRAKGISMQ